MSSVLETPHSAPAKGDHATCSAPQLLAAGAISALSLKSNVRAGFPSPAEDFQAKRIDVLERLVKHPQATYSMIVRGESMREAGIFDGDVLTSHCSQPIGVAQTVCSASLKYPGVEMLLR
jgi:DNA polymerase V